MLSSAQLQAVQEVGKPSEQLQTYNVRIQLLH